jgi:hypothetical protein
MRVTYLLICVIVLVSSLTASAMVSDKAYPENGVWTGTIGDRKVMACFMRDYNPAHTNQSAYFYLRYSKLISLVPDPDSNALWLEGDSKSPSGIWKINVQHDRITGNWSNFAKTKTLPILLNRFKSISSDHSSSCSPESSVFGPDAYSEKIAFGEGKTLNGRSYRVLVALRGAVKTVELIGENETITVLNTLLANELRVGVRAYYECPTNGESYSGTSAKQEWPDYYSSIEPLFWNKQWISFVARTSGDCGGAHPFSDYSYSTWNLSTGKELNLWEWIRNSKKASSSPEYDHYYFNYSAPEKLNRIITRKAIKQRLAFNPKEAREENNCLDVIQSNSEYQIRLGKFGFIFTQAFPHVVQACTDDIEITYGELVPFLAKKGKEAVMAMQHDRLD